MLQLIVYWSDGTRVRSSHTIVVIFQLPWLHVGCQKRSEIKASITLCHWKWFWNQIDIVKKQMRREKRTDGHRESERERGRGNRNERGIKREGAGREGHVTWREHHFVAWFQIHADQWHYWSCIFGLSHSHHSQETQARPAVIVLNRQHISHSSHLIINSAKKKMFSHCQLCLFSANLTCGNICMNITRFNNWDINWTSSTDMWLTEIE